MTPLISSTISSKKSTKIILAKWVLPVSSGNVEILEDHAIVVADGLITQILPNEEAKEAFREGEELIDLSRSHLLIPGLINCHAHSGMTLLRGYADDQPLKIWLEKFIWPTDAEFVSPEYVELSTEIAAAEMARGGTTFVNDMYFYSSTAATVFSRVGLRCCCGDAVIDVSADDGLDERRQHIEKVKLSVSNLRNMNSDGKITPSVCIHANYTVDKETYRELAVYGRAEQIRVHTHLHETEKEIEEYKTAHSCTPIEDLESIGALDNNLVAAHCVHLSEADIRLLASRRVNVVHNPRSNLKLASGICPVKSLMDAGVNVCLGTDSACSNNSLSMLDEMQMASLLSKGATGDVTSLNAYEALRMATINGAKAMGQEDRIGSLEVGKDADIVAVNAADDEPENLPIYDPLSHLVYTTKHKVTHTWVRGTAVVEDGVVIRSNIQLDKVRHTVDKIKKFRSKLMNNMMSTE